ncbi:UV DNA damage repair endonuclease UvsE [Alteribacter populi]|uniref:UV DNA damage repair endonuclease UvsE n=1 Tax=Alteribacter populi TaxID=2011011 RepID=UPI000BBB221F|nr:UV DNA damage repair endonuclease UvsE [Alteribacter populi]
MKIRFGFVAHATSLHKCSPSHTITWAQAKKLTKTERKNKLMEVTAKNIAHTKRAIHYCIAQEFDLFRLSSAMVPLATHPDVMWDFVEPFQQEWRQLGKLISDHGIRVSFHPNQFTLFTSDKSEVTERSVKDLHFHNKMANAMCLPECRFVLHIGGIYGNKEAAIERFHKNVRVLPAHLKDRLMFENDDKSYHAYDVLGICIEEQLPFVFDYHHHVVHQGERTLEDILPQMIKTWEHTKLPPKIHLSSPKDGNRSRAHADRLDLSFVRPFLESMRAFDTDFDVMIEAKQKDKALLHFLNDLEKIRGVNRLSGGTIAYKP